MIKKISPEQVAAEKAAIIAATRPTGRPKKLDVVTRAIWEYRDLAPELSLSQFAKFLEGKPLPDGTPIRKYDVSYLSRVLKGYPAKQSLPPQQVDDGGVLEHPQPTLKQHKTYVLDYTTDDINNAFSFATIFSQEDPNGECDVTTTTTYHIRMFCSSKQAAAKLKLIISEG